MDEKRVRTTLLLGIVGVVVATGVREMIHNHRVEVYKRKRILDGMGMDVEAIHNAADHVNTRIERGEIRSLDELRDAVTTEVAFQKMAIREDPAEKSD